MRLTREAVSRVTLCGLLLGAVTLSPLVAQAQPPTGAKETVEIKEEGKKKPPVAAKEAPANIQKKAVSNRDPFVNYSASGGGVVTKTEGTTSKDALAKKDKKAGPNKAPKAEKPKEVEIPPPAVTVQGIVVSGSGNRAILTSPNQTYIVRSGDKLGDYKVDSVQPKMVVFRYKDKTFKLKMEDQFAAASHSAGKSGKKK